MSYNQRCGKMNKSESKPVEKALPADQLILLVNVEVRNLSTKLKNLVGNASKIKDLARKLAGVGKRRAREGGDRDSSEYYAVTRGVEEAADRIENAVNVAEDQAYMILSDVAELRKYERGGRFRP